MLKQISTLCSLAVFLYVASTWLDGCTISNGFAHISRQNQVQSGLIVKGSTSDSLRTAILQKQNDSLMHQIHSLADGNGVLMSYAASVDSLLRVQTDSTRREKEENQYIRMRQVQSNQSIQQMFWVLASGQQDLRLIVDSVRKESKALIQARHQLETERAAIEELQSKILDTTPLKTTELAMEKDSKRIAIEKPTRKAKSNSVNNRKRQRQAERRTRQVRRRSLLRG